MLRIYIKKMKFHDPIEVQGPWRKTVGRRISAKTVGRRISALFYLTGKEGGSRKLDRSPMWGIDRDATFFFLPLLPKLIYSHLKFGATLQVMTIDSMKLSQHTSHFSILIIRNINISFLIILNINLWREIVNYCNRDDSLSFLPKIIIQ